MTARDLSARAGRVTRPEETRAKTPAPRVAQVRLSVDIPPAHYQAITAWPAEAGIPEAAGVLKVPTVEVYRALTAELLASPELQARVSIRVIDELREQAAEKARNRGRK